MMNKLRQHMPLILWILVIAFIGTIVFSWGMGGFEEKQKPGIVGRIDGREITRDYLDQLTERQYQNTAANTDAEMPESAMRDIRAQIWEEIIKEVLLQKEAGRLNIVVTDQEVVHQVRNYPPQFLQELEVFQSDGAFDIEKYHQFLQDPRNVNQVIILEQTYRQTINENKLLNKITSAVNITTEELLRRFEERNVKGKAKFVKFAAEDIEVDSSEITESAITDYYYKNIDDFHVPEKRRLIFAKFEEETTHEDSQAVIKLGDEIYERILKSGDFAEMARVYSEHHTAPDGGDLGYIPRKQLEQESDSLVWNAEPGEITPPFVNRFGLFIYKVEDRKVIDGELKTKARIIQLKFESFPETKENILNKAQNFAEEVREYGFKAVAEAYNVKIDTSGYYEQLMFIPGIGRMISIVDFSFNFPVGTVSDIYPLRTGWLIFQIVNIQPQHNKPLAEVRGEIFSELIAERKLQKSYEQCRQFFSRIDDHSRWFETAENEGLTVLETSKLFNFNDYLPELGRDLAFTATVLSAETGKLIGPIEGEKGAYLLEYLEIVPIDTAVFYVGLEENRFKMLQSKKETIYKSWYQNLKDNAKIEDFRYLYYKDL
ncbi:SurA N-terminal domain-containing protein [bacterium]|nr:SurA N-terminal domain-containing protein [bacterium]